MASISPLIVACLLAACLDFAIAAKQIGKGYSFAYNAGDSSRSEDADQLGEIQGAYRYISDDGTEKAVRYSAGHSGFEATGENIVNVPRLIELIRASDALEGRYEPSSEEIESWGNADRSYSLAYHAGDSARSEVAHPSGYVTGQYSYLDKDGSKRIVEYEAGPGIGFRVKGDHIHSNIADHSVPSSFSSPNLQLSQYTLRSGLEHHEPSDVKTQYNDDGSVTYSYETSTESRTETVDRRGNIRGSYTFIGDDGRSRTVHYTGGRGTGFQVSGDGIHESAGRQVTGSLTGRAVFKVPSQHVDVSRTQTTTETRNAGLSGSSGVATQIPSYDRYSNRRDYTYYSNAHRAGNAATLSNQILSGRRALSSHGSHRTVSHLTSNAAQTFNRLLGLQSGLRTVAPGVSVRRTVVTRKYPHAFGLSGTSANTIQQSTSKVRSGVVQPGFISFSTPDGRAHNFGVGN